MAGSVDLRQRCFAGLETRQGALWFNPHRPERFGALEFVVRYRGHAVGVRVSGREVREGRVAAEPGPAGPIRVGCGDVVRTLRAGEATRFGVRSGNRVAPPQV